MKLSVIAVTCCVLLGTLSGCSLDRSSQSNASLPAQQPSTMTPQASAKEVIKERADDSVSGNKVSNNKDLQDLKAQLAKQQQQLEIMNSEQQALQEQLKRQSLDLQIIPTATANAGRTKVGTASTAYIAFLEDASQFADAEELFSKEISVIPNRKSTTKLSIPQETRFIAIKVELRYTKKRSQLLIPIDSIDFDKPLAINIGACDINIESGVDPKLSAEYVNKLKYYQQPIASCL